MRKREFSISPCGAFWTFFSMRSAFDQTIFYFLSSLSQLRELLYYLYFMCEQLFGIINFTWDFSVYWNSLLLVLDYVCDRRITKKNHFQLPYLPLSWSSSSLFEFIYRNVVHVIVWVYTFDQRIYTINILKRHKNFII